MLEVHEIFHSIQGEGPFAGWPAVFLRLSGCVRPYCDFCDTREALEKGKPMEISEIFSEIGKYGCSLVVITGGEPFLQWEKGLSGLEERLLAEGFEVQYETSARAGVPEDARGKVVLSPKPGQWPGREILSRAFCLKVLWEEERSSDILREIADSGFPPGKIWLMCLGASREEQLARMPLLWEVCVREGYHLSPRLHILAFDQKRGI